MSFSAKPVERQANSNGEVPTEHSSVTEAQDDLAVDERLLALERVLQSKTFCNAGSMRHFLEFIVERSVAGRVDEIKEYTIATEVLRRSDDFDPKTDNIVRVQAHRLRNKLEEYYSREGIRDPVRIFIPSGHYYPEYDTKRSTQETAAVEPIPISDDVTETLPAEKPSPAAHVSNARMATFHRHGSATADCLQ